MSNRHRSVQAIVASALIVVVSLAWLVVHNHMIQHSNEVVKDAVGKAIIAMKHKDISTLAHLLHTRSVDYSCVSQLLVHRRTRCYPLDYCRKYYRLAGVSDADILRSVKVEEHPPQRVVAHLLHMNAGETQVDDWPQWLTGTPVIVTYSIRGVDMMSIALQEQGIWKLSALPCQLSPRVLKYKTVTEAGGYAYPPLPSLPGELLTNITSRDFDKRVLQNRQPVIVEFCAEWCLSCRLSEPAVQDVAQEYRRSVTMVRVDVDSNKTLGKRYNVHMLPTLLFFREGHEVDRMVGIHSRQALLLWVRKNVSRRGNGSHQHDESSTGGVSGNPFPETPEPGESE